MTKQLTNQGTTGLALLALVAVTMGAPDSAYSAGQGGQTNGNGEGGVPVTVPSVYVVGPVGPAPLDPTDPVWDATSFQAVAMEQEYEVESVPEPPGLPDTKSLSIRSLNDGEFIYFNFKWADATPNDTVGDPRLFGDAVAIESPFAGTAPGDEGIEMGEPDLPVNIIFWRADLDRPQNITGVGEGSVTITPNSGSLTLLQSRQHQAGEWNVVIGRRMTTENAEEQMSYTRGQSYSVAYAIWDGHVQERNGNKYIRHDWDSLEVQ